MSTNPHILIVPTRMDWDDSNELWEAVFTLEECRMIAQDLEGQDFGSSEEKVAKLFRGIVDTFEEMETWEGGC